MPCCVVLPHRSCCNLPLPLPPVVCLARGAQAKALVYLGLVGLQDPPRDDVQGALQVLASTGVNVKMVTGDAMETACAVARAVGLQVRGRRALFSYFVLIFTLVVL